MNEVVKRHVGRQPSLNATRDKAHFGQIFQEKPLPLPGIWRPAIIRAVRRCCSSVPERRSFGLRLGAHLGSFWCNRSAELHFQKLENANRGQNPARNRRSLKHQSEQAGSIMSFYARRRRRMALLLRNSGGRAAACRSFLAIVGQVSLGMLTNAFTICGSN